MKKRVFVLLTAFIAVGTTVQSQETAPLKLIQTITLPPDVKGHFDHFEVDVKGNRFFATPESYKAVLVFDLETGKAVHTISGIEKPHAVLYREDLQRIYVTDGDAGDLKIFDGDGRKNGAPELNRYFVAVPQHGTTSAEILVFEVH